MREFFVPKKIRYTASMDNTNTQSTNEAEVLFEKLLADLDRLEKERENIVKEYQNALEARKTSRVKETIASL